MTGMHSWLTSTPGDWPRLRGKVTYPSRASVLELAVHLARPVAGNVIEFGVFKGASTRVIRDELYRSPVWNFRRPPKRIFACDSFDGLPDDYENLAAGTFATPVPTLRGVRIVKGFFEDSLTPALAKEVGPVSLAHFDADLFSATETALNWIDPLLHGGSLLLFDEFDGTDDAEARAFAEWSERTDHQLTLIAMFGREPSGKGDTPDRRALFQVIGDEHHRTPPALLPTRIRRRIASSW
jgi:hypothetical protein